MSVATGTDNSSARGGMGLMIVAMAIFAAQDGISRHLGGAYGVPMVVMIRYWFFAAFILWMAARSGGGVRAAAATRAPRLQILRGVLLAVEINVMVLAFVNAGLVESHSIFAGYPLLVAALAGPVLGERVGWRRWTAILAGFAGVLVILVPGLSVFSIGSTYAVISTAMFAIYAVLTRRVARVDSAATSFFWTGAAGLPVATGIGIWFWEPMTRADWGWMGVLCVTAVAGHYLLIRCYQLAEASALQPLAYLQPMLAALVGVFVFSEAVHANVALGAAIVVAAGMFTLWREARNRARQGVSR